MRRGGCGQLGETSFPFYSLPFFLVLVYDGSICEVGVGILARLRNEMLLCSFPHTSFPARTESSSVNLFFFCVIKGRVCFPSFVVALMGIRI
jgi:hypothetical protein